jgi:putative transposase
LRKVLGVHSSGFYAWRLSPESRRAKEDKRLLVPIRESWLESRSVYGYRRSAMIYVSSMNNAASIAFIV